MKTVVRIMINGHHIPGGPQTILGPAGCGPDVAKVEDLAAIKEIVVLVTLEVTDPRLPVLLELLKPYDDDPLMDYDDCFTEEEMNSARLLVMRPNREVDLFGGVEYGMTYDFSGACPACRTGGRQTSALFIDGKQLPLLEGRRAAGTIFYHLLVDEGLEQDLLRSGATGITFRSVYALMPDGRQRKLRYRQLCANRTLPPMSPSTTGLLRDRACEVCRRNGYCQTRAAPTRIVYRAADLRDADDVNTCWENLGYAIIEPELRDSLLSYPWTLVTPKVRRVFLDAGVTELDWFPVRVEGDAQVP